MVTSTCAASAVLFDQMSNMTSDSEDRMMSGGCIDSPSVDETNSGGGNMGASAPLKKGPWTSAEDAILVDYVSKHGEGNWNAVQKHSGLFRCGKSCRLRWANHLRPDLKKGAFTQEEERRIIELHAKMGNKWARMAAELPGRTDNEIKNFWNTRIKRRQRAGLPIYPPDICLQAFNENQQSQNMVTFAAGDSTHAEILATNNLEIPAVEFKNLELNQDFYPPVVLDMSGSNLLDIPGNGLLGQGLGSSCSSNFLFPITHPPPKRMRRSESLFPGCGVGLNDVLPTFDQYQDDGSEKIAESYEFTSSYRHNLNMSNLPSSSSLFHGSHALSNGNSSSSEPISWAMKLELPSLQYSDNQVGSWGTPSSPLPSLESVDTLIQSPPMEHTKSECLSPRNSGLLEAVLYESRSLKMSKSNSCHQISNGSVIPGEVADSSSQNIHETEWEAYADPISPLGHSAASVFSEYTPISGSSLDEHQSVKIVPVKPEALEYVSTQSNRKDEVMNHLDYSRPDFLLGSNWFGSSSERGKDHSMLTDAIGALLGNDSR